MKNYLNLRIYRNSVQRRVSAFYCIAFILLIVLFQTNYCPMCVEPFYECEQPGIVHTFMFTRPVYRNIAAQQAIWHNILFDQTCEGSAGLQIVPIYQRSISNDGVSSYFLYKHQNSLTVKGDAAVTIPPGTLPINALRDVRAEWVGLPTDFDGFMSVNPKQKQFGLWLEYKQDFLKVIDHPWFDSLWVSLAAPVQIIKNNINITSNSSALLEAFDNPDWNYAKFSNQTFKKVALAEFIAKFGVKMLNRDGFQFAVTTILTAPLHGRQNPEYVFNSFVGHNRHFGFGTGVLLQLPLNRDLCCKLISFYLNVENIYFIRNTQHRTFDLMGKPFSRYLLFNKIDGTTNIPGANVLTLKVHVRPYNMVNLASGFRWNSNGLEVEIGYDLWARGREKIRLKEYFPNDVYGIAGVGTIPGTGIGATASLSNITEQAPNDQVDGQNVFVGLNFNDGSSLDLTSAAAASALTNGAHLSVGYTLEYDQADIFFGVGGFVEVPHYNTALENAGFWVKVGCEW